MNAQLTLAQTTLAHKLGISRQWVGTLVQRLEETGWLIHTSEKLAGRHQWQHDLAHWPHAQAAARDAHQE